ncbi:hypothetical protein GCM10010435_90900 [Winogradskya consettensis]|uniref:Uncharacterized protein n=1 Tax=Winogradskya consettensis TaxID=113560 RepID=A0A919SLT7_9ACTN|nr:hypothetical protein [Actinoplanes consettensis]GIM73283.1 hypothetical protein Aco04nite_34470 [Actinoplanes consettensis]
MIISLVAVSAPAQAAPSYDGIVPTQAYNYVCVNATINTAVVCQTDNADVYWYADSNDPGELETDDQDAVRSMLADEYSPTDIAIHYDSSPVFEGDAETDLIYQEGEAAQPVPSGYWGVTWCNGQAPATYECDQTYVRIASPDGYRIHGGSIACHETGHAVGLVHGNDAYPYVDPGAAGLGCMVNEDEFPSALGANNAYFINYTY